MIMTIITIGVLDRGGGVHCSVYFCGSLLSTQKSRIKKRKVMTKKSNEIKEVTYLIGDRLVYGSNVDIILFTGA